MTDCGRSVDGGDDDERRLEIAGREIVTGRLFGSVIEMGQPDIVLKAVKTENSCSV